MTPYGLQGSSHLTQSPINMYKNLNGSRENSRTPNLVSNPQYAEKGLKKEYGVYKRNDSSNDLSILDKNKKMSDRI